MSQENVEILRRGDDAIQRGDLSAALADVDEDVEASRVSPLPDVRSYRGRDGMLQMLLDWVEGFDEWAMTFEEYVDVDDHQVIVRVHQRAVGSQSSAPIEADFWFLYGFRDGRVVRLDMYAREAQALEAAGLSE
jgi:ketosteroid isomerase-like protein